MTGSGSGGILVTGGAGYVGSRLIRDLVADDRFADRPIRIYDNLLRHQHAALLDLPKMAQIEFVEGDILDRVNLRRALDGVSLVIHLAAVVRTPLSFDHPAQTEQINHWGTATVAEAAIEAGVESCVHVSSAVVYGPGGPFREDDACKPVGPYAESKLRGEHEMIEAAERGLNVSILRLGTVYGNAPAMRFDAVVNRFAFLASVGRPMVLLGDGDQLRPFIHVADASAAIRFSAAGPGMPGRVLNAVSQNIHLKEIADQIREYVPHSRITHAEQDYLSKVSFEVSGDRMRELGFQPAFTLEDGLLEMLGRTEGLKPYR